MQKRLMLPTIISLAFLWFIGALRPEVYARQNPTKQLPKEISDLTGTFTGEWSMFGIDASGQVVKKMSWTDIIKTENPVIKGDKAFVTTIDEMSFEGGKIPPRKFQGTEGYFINQDGSLGEYFIESSGQITKMQRLEKNVWAYATAASTQEMMQLGFTNVASAQHTLLKVVIQDNGAETHRITRITTVNWKDKEGKEHWMQYISLQGFHKKQTS
jgi:hypothetical protein